MSHYHAGSFSNGQSEMIKLTDLSDTEIDQIVEVKSAMYAASIESY